MLFDTRFLKELSLAISGLLAAGAIGCSRANESGETPPPTEGSSLVRSSADTDTPLRFSVKSLVTPRESFSHYYDLFKYLESKIGRTIQFTYRRSYSEVSALLKSGDVDAAFVCGLTYAGGHDGFGLELLVVPQVYGKTEYHSTILVPVGSPARGLEDLRGKRFAFADPQSHSGKFVIADLLSKMDETPETFFVKYIYTYAHGRSVQAVAAKAVDGAVEDVVPRGGGRVAGRRRLVRRHGPLRRDPDRPGAGAGDPGDRLVGRAAGRALPDPAGALHIDRR